jgi:hypothetical protein
MRRTFAAAVIAVLASVLVASPSQAAIGRVEPGASFQGHDLVEWQRMYERWRLGSNEPFFDGCGTIVDGVLFVDPVIFGLAKLGCDIPAGTPILLEAGAAFSAIPDYAATRAEARADARANWSVISTGVAVDSTVIRSDDLYREGGVYRVRSVQGSELGIECAIVVAPCLSDVTPPGPATIASVGMFVMLRPLPPGDHLLSIDVEYPDDILSLWATIHVG